MWRVSALQYARDVLDTMSKRNDAAEYHRVTMALAGLVKSLELSEDERLLVEGIAAAPGAVTTSEAQDIVELVRRLIGER